MVTELTLAGDSARATNVAASGDVDLFATQLPADDLDSRAPQAYAGADRIHVALGRRHGDLGALSSFAGGLADLDDALGDFGNLRLEQADEKAGMRP
jgi:hypothetical protein